MSSQGKSLCPSISGTTLSTSLPLKSFWRAFRGNHFVKAQVKRIEIKIDVSAMKLLDEKFGEVNYFLLLSMS